MQRSDLSSSSSNSPHISPHFLVLQFSLDTCHCCPPQIWTADLEYQHYRYSVFHQVVPVEDNLLHFQSLLLPFSNITVNRPYSFIATAPYRELRLTLPSDNGNTPQTIPSNVPFPQQDLPRHPSFAINFNLNPPRFPMWRYHVQPSSPRSPVPHDG